LVHPIQLNVNLGANKGVGNPWNFHTIVYNIHVLKNHFKVMVINPSCYKLLIWMLMNTNLKFQVLVLVMDFWTSTIIALKVVDFAKDSNKRFLII
jgi:hypothetical protein